MSLCCREHWVVEDHALLCQRIESIKQILLQGGSLLEQSRDLIKPDSVRGLALDLKFMEAPVEEPDQVELLAVS